MTTPCVDCDTDDQPVPDGLVGPVNAVLARLSFLRWGTTYAFEVVRHPDDGDWQMRITFTVEDGATWHWWSHCPSEVIGDPTAQAVLRWAFRELAVSELHEVAEFLRFDDRAPFDPHRSGTDDLLRSIPLIEMPWPFIPTGGGPLDGLRPVPL